MGVLPTDVAQYGIGFFAVAGLIYLVSQWLKQRADQSLAVVIENNTKALEQLTSTIQVIQVNLARQEAKIDEILERARAVRG